MSSSWHSMSVLGHWSGSNSNIRNNLYILVSFLGLLLFFIINKRTRNHLFHWVNFVLVKTNNQILMKKKKRYISVSIFESYLLVYIVLVSQNCNGRGAIKIKRTMDQLGNKTNRKRVGLCSYPFVYRSHVF